MIYSVDPPAAKRRCNFRRGAWECAALEHPDDPERHYFTKAEPPMLESQLESFFRDRVRRLGGYTIKLAPTEKGVPDRLAIFPGGRIYMVELKTETGRLSPAQIHWHQRMAARNVQVYTLYGRQDIIEWVRYAFGGDSGTRSTTRWNDSDDDEGDQQ